MERYIVILNITSAIVIFMSITIVLLRFIKMKITYHILIGLSMIIILVNSVINILEHNGMIGNAEEYEQIFSILFLPILIFAIHESVVQKEMQKRKQSEHKFKGIFNQAFSFIGLLDKDGRLIDANETALKFAGYKNNEFEGQYFFETKWWEGEEEILKIKNAITLAQSGKMARFETFHRDINKNIHYVDVSVNPVFDDKGNVVYLIPEGRDITEMKIAERELENHKNNLEKLVSEKTTDLESAYQELQSINEELHDKNEIISEQNQKLKSTLQNLKETQAQLLQSEKMASLGILTAGVAHEINNPLNFIIGAYEGLSNHFSNNSFSENREQIELLINALKLGVDRSSAIVNGLNQFSRKTDSHNEDCDIHAIINNSLNMLQNQYKHHIEVKKIFSDSVYGIKGNVGNLHQVFINVLSNAIQSINSKGEIVIKTAFEKRHVIITVTDSGSGISAENLKKITDPFFTTKDPGKGTGLGLSITYNIIKEHKGSLEFESEVGKGTMVRIVLPKSDL